MQDDQDSEGQSWRELEDGSEGEGEGDGGSIVVGGANELALPFVPAPSNDDSSEPGSQSVRDMSENQSTTVNTGENASRERTVGEMPRSTETEIQSLSQAVTRTMVDKKNPKQFEDKPFHTQLPSTKNSDRPSRPFVGVIKKQQVPKNPPSQQKYDKKQEPPKYDDEEPDSHHRSRSYIALQDQNERLKREVARLTEIKQELQMKNSVGSSKSSDVKVLENQVKSMNQDLKECKTVIKQLSEKFLQKEEEQQKPTKQKLSLSLNSPKFAEDQQQQEYKKLSVYTSKKSVRPEEKPQKIMRNDGRLRKEETIVTVHSVYSQRQSLPREKVPSQYKSIYSEVSEDEEQEQRPNNQNKSVQRSAKDKNFKNQTKHEQKDQSTVSGGSRSQLHNAGTQVDLVNDDQQQISMRALRNRQREKGESSTAGGSKCCGFF